MVIMNANPLQRKKPTRGLASKRIRCTIWFCTAAALLLLHRLRPSIESATDLDDDAADPSNVLRMPVDAGATHHHGERSLIDAQQNKVTDAQQGKAASQSAAKKRMERLAKAWAARGNDTRIPSHILDWNVFRTKRKPLVTKGKGQNEVWGIIHLGKCGGVSMQKTLQGYLSHRTTIGQIARRSKWYHLSIPEVEKYKSWMLLVRDPVSRIQSWWMYDHIDNFDYRIDYLGFPARSHLWPKVFECYPTLNDFCVKGLAPTPTAAFLTDECQILAQMAIPFRDRSFVAGFQHLYFNFEKFFKDLLAVADKKRIYVVRTEHMLDDLNDINHRLGDARNVTGLVHISHWRASNYPHNDRHVSQEGIENLCRHLCNEIQHYKKILNVGINIQRDAVIASLRELQKSCPREVSSSDCPLDEQVWRKTMAVFQKIKQDEQSRMFRGMQEVKRLRTDPPRRMEKAIRIQNHFHPNSEDSYGVLHLGRCGGRTVRQLLQSQEESSKLFAKLQNGWTLPDVAIWPQHRHWVILVRDPIDRLMSWWAYHHPANLHMRPDREKQLRKPPHLRAELNELYECFPTFQDLVSATGTTTAYSECKNRAKAAIPVRGESYVIPSMDDVGFMYSAHLQHIKANADKRFLIVVRMEHMVEDLNGIEGILSENLQQSALFDEKTAQQMKADSSAEAWPVSSRQDVDPDSMKGLCSTMCIHFFAYEFILREAINLSTEVVEHSMTLLKQKCPGYTGTCAKG